MGSDSTFFVSWQLWEQMTLVLGLAIVLVFCIGLIKLWWNGRLTKRRELLNEEKKTRLMEMGRTGLSAKRNNEVPFGVRAIQSGVEVDGIWISRPATPNVEASGKLASATTLVGMDTDSQHKVKFASDDSISRSITSSTLNQERSPVAYAPADGSISQRLGERDLLSGAPPTTIPVSHFAPQNKRPNPRMPGVMNEDTLHRLDGQPLSRPTYETYTPSSAQQNPRQVSQRSTNSSSGESMRSARSYSSTRNSRPRVSRNAHNARANYPSSMPASPDHEGRDPFAAPARSATGSLAYAHEFQENSQALHMPRPTFGPGDMQANRPGRRMHQDYDALPGESFDAAQDYRGHESAPE